MTKLLINQHIYYNFFGEIHFFFKHYIILMFEFLVLLIYD
jgi:hypothetical protein